MRQRPVDVHVLAGESDVVEQVFDLIEKLIVVVHRAERDAIVEQRLLDARFDAVRLLGLETGIGQHGKLARQPERLLEAGLLDAFGVAGAQPRRAEDVTPAKQNNRSRNAR